MEVVDLLSVSPLDEAIILDSVRKTRKIVIVDEDYPHYIGLDFAPEYRARRITELLGQDAKFTVEKARRMQADAVSFVTPSDVSMHNSYPGASAPAANQLETCDKTVLLISLF